VLVVDIQEDYTGPKAAKPYRDADRIITATNTLLARAEEKGLVVVYIENVIENPVFRLLAGGMNAPGAPGTAVDSRILRVPGARTFSKGRSDSFSNPELEAWLAQNQVEQLYLVGLDGAYCVNATARGALNRGYKVTLVTDGIATETSSTLEELSAKWRKAGATVATTATLSL